MVEIEVQKSLPRRLYLASLCCREKCKYCDRCGIMSEHLQQVSKI